MKNQKTEYPVMVLREDLRQQANEKTARISRSVARLTSCDLPCPEYGEEVEHQQGMTQEGSKFPVRYILDPAYGVAGGCVRGDSGIGADEAQCGTKSNI